MRKIIFLLLLAVVAQGAYAQARISIEKAGGGKIRIFTGSASTVVELRKDVAGCAFLGPGDYKKQLDAMGCAATPATFKLVDGVTKGGSTYLVVLSEALGNCNVCGQCGASDAFTLIWLKLDGRLRVTGRKSVPIEFCRDNVALVSPSVELREGAAGETIKLEDDVLTVTFEKSNHDGQGNRAFLFSTLVYNRKSPERGFVIKSENRVDSSINPE